MARNGLLRFARPMRVHGWRLGVVTCSIGLLGCASSGATVSVGTPMVATNVLAYYPLLPGWGWAYEVESEGTTVLELYSVSERRNAVSIGA